MADPYYLAARFPAKEQAGEAYFPLQKIVFEAKELCDLSVYRLAVSGVWHVVVLGVKPPIELHLRIEAVLTRGVLVNLRADVLRYLYGRRSDASQLGSWVEGHYDH